MKFNLDSFKRWLYNQDDDRVFVGGANRCRTCPIATFLVEGLGHKNVSVGINGYTVDDGSSLEEMPSWAVSFVDAYDQNGGMDVEDAKDALEWVEEWRV